MLDGIKNIKIKRKEMNIIKSKDVDIESVLREQIKPKYRMKKVISLKKYKHIFLRATIFSTLILIIIVPLSIRGVLQYFDDMSIEEIKKASIAVYCASLCAVLLPYLPSNIFLILSSRLGKLFLAWPFAKKHFKRIDKVIELCHHCSNMLLVAKTNIQIEYFTSKSQIYARRALMKILKLTNTYIRELYYPGLNAKQKRDFAIKIENYLKDLNGSLIMTYKGKVPKHVTDAFEQISMNLIELRKKEVGL